MPSIINASSSGSGGIVQTADASGVLQLQTNGTVALSIDTSANITFADGSKNLTLQQTTAAGANSTSYPGYIAFTGFGWNTSLGSQPVGVRISAGGNYSPALGQTATGLSISTQSSNGSMTQRSILNAFGLGLGTGTIPLSGTGITFPATQDPSSDANTLDDYEEGSWTPVLSGIGSGTLTEQYGRYTKIGNLVFVTGKLAWTGKTGTDSLFITGLPFNAFEASDSGSRSSCLPEGDWQNINDLMDLNGQFRINGANLQGVIDSGSGSSIIMTAGNVGTNAEFNFSLTYRATA